MPDRFFVYGVRSDIKVDRWASVPKAIAEYAKTYLEEIYGIKSASVESTKASFTILGVDAKARAPAGAGVVKVTSSEMTKRISGVQKSVQRSRGAIPIKTAFVSSFEITYNVGGERSVECVDFICIYNPKHKVLTIIVVPSMVLDGISLDVAKADITGNSTGIKSGSKRPA